MSLRESSYRCMAFGLKDWCCECSSALRRWRCQCMGSVQAICPEAPEHCREQGTYVHVDHGVLRPTRVVCRTFFKLVYSRLVRAEDCPNERCHLPLKRHGLVLGHPHRRWGGRQRAARRLGRFKGMWHTNTITLVCGFARRSRGRSGSGECYIIINSRGGGVGVYPFIANQHESAGCQCGIAACDCAGLSYLFKSVTTNHEPIIGAYPESRVISFGVASC